MFECLWIRGAPKYFLVLSLVMTLFSCTSKPPRTNFYGATGKMNHAILCPVGHYETCLHEAGDICGSQGYSIHEKIRQTKSNYLGDDNVEFLIVAQCMESNKLNESSNQTESSESAQNK
jgi:hypothetical protein